MRDALEEAKAKLSSEYLGKAGIHAIAVRDPDVVRVYYHGPHSEERQRTFERLMRDARPYSVRLLEEPQPNAFPAA